MSKRPRYTDQELALQVAQNLLPRVRRWAEEQETDDELQREPAAAIHRSAPLFQPDEIAQCLEKRYLWASDETLVDILDAVDIAAHAVHAEAVAEWVKSNGIRARKVIGDIVDVRPRASAPELVQLKGEIVGINAEQATYSVFVSGCGHVRKGPGTHSHILPFEEFHGLATPAEEFELQVQ